MGKYWVFLLFISPKNALINGATQLVPPKP